MSSRGLYEFIQRGTYVIAIVSRTSLILAVLSALPAAGQVQLEGSMDFG